MQVPPPWLIAMQRYGPPPSYPNLKIPGLNAPIPEGCSFGYHAGGWGKPPVDESGKPLYGDVFGTLGTIAPSEGEDEEVDRTMWGELESESEESEEEEEEEEEEQPQEDETGLVTPAEGLVTPSGITSIPAGLETPEIIELRKKKIESDMEGFVFFYLSKSPTILVKINANPIITQSSLFQVGNSSVVSSSSRKESRQDSRSHDGFYSHLRNESNDSDNRKRSTTAQKRCRGFSDGGTGFGSFRIRFGRYGRHGRPLRTANSRTAVAVAKGGFIRYGCGTRIQAKSKQIYLSYVKYSLVPVLVSN